MAGNAAAVAAGRAAVGEVKGEGDSSIKRVMVVACVSSLAWVLGDTSDVASVCVSEGDCGCSSIAMKMKQKCKMKKKYFFAIEKKRNVVPDLSLPCP